MKKSLLIIIIIIIWYWFTYYLVNLNKQNEEIVDYNNEIINIDTLNIDKNINEDINDDINDDIERVDYYDNWKL